MKPPFSPERRPYRTARERVAARRAARGQVAPRRKSLALPGVALLLVALLAVGLWSWIGGTLRAFQQEDPRQSATATGRAAFDAGALPQDLREPFNVLLIGVDRRPDPEEGARSDTLILVHVNPAGGGPGCFPFPATRWCRSLVWERPRSTPPTPTATITPRRSTAGRRTRSRRGRPGCRNRRRLPRGRGGLHRPG